MDTRSCFVAIVGRANAGKSSLLNALLGEKLAIVSDKPQTTRTRITGILTDEQDQFVFIDTPGLHKPKNKLSNHMLKSAKSVVGDVDVVIMVVDASRGFDGIEANLISSIKSAGIPSVLVINKIDLLTSKEMIANMIAKAVSFHDFDEIVPISVLENDGVSIVKDVIRKYASESPHFFPDDMLTDQPEKVLVGEIIREKILRLLSKEVPHGIAVAIEKMSTRENKDIIDIEATIYCERESHKGIVIGKGGAMLKKIGTLSREDLEYFFGEKVNLKCWVKVKEDWRNKEGSIQNFGLGE